MQVRPADRTRTEKGNTAMKPHPSFTTAPAARFPAKFAVALALTLLLLTLCSCSYAPPRRIINDSALFSTDEINHAMHQVELHFRKHFHGCIFNSLVYDETVSLKSADEWAAQYDADEAIVLTSSFTVGPHGGDGSLNPNYTYENWQWILTRSTGGGWVLQTWGY